MRFNIPFMRYHKIFIAIAASFVILSLGLVLPAASTWASTLRAAT